MQHFLKKAVYFLNAYLPEAQLLSSTTQAEINFHTHSLFCYFLPKTRLSTTHLQLFTRNYKTYYFERTYPISSLPLTSLTALKSDFSQTNFGTEMQIIATAELKY